MLCPYCLEQVTFQEVREQAARSDGFLAALLRFLVSFRKSRKLVGFRCPNPECKQFVPVMYVRDYDRFPPAVVSAVGFSKHGETVFFGSLMHALRSAMLHERWPDSFTLALDDSSLATVLANVRSLDSGHLPPSTANNFPRPTLLRIGNVPTLPDCTLAIYDLSGDSFREAQSVQRNGRFLARARTVLFLVSIPDLIDEYGQCGQALDQLLDAYIVGMRQLGGNTQTQNLVVVYTKADLLSDYLQGWKTLQDYVRSPGFDGLEDLAQYRARLREMSRELHEFTFRGLQAGEFLAVAGKNFHSVSFTIISSLGAAPNDTTNRLESQIAPIRVLDPLLMLMTDA